MDQHQTKQTKGFDQEAFASILNRIIKKRGIRKQDFAIEAGIRNTSLSRYLTGKLLQPPHFNNLERIAAASGDPERIFPELLDVTGYTRKDYEDYKKRGEQKLEARRDVEDAVWDTCGKLLHMNEQDLKQAFGCTSVQAVMQKYRYQEAVNILYNNYANSRIGLVARGETPDGNSRWGVITSWQGGIYQILMEDGKTIGIPEGQIGWHPEEPDLRSLGLAEIAEALRRLNEAT
jgi:transcriptional regulator with XRE-family HTH domain